MTPPGYQIREVIFEDASVVVYRGRRIQDQQAVLLKMARVDYPSAANVSRLQREYEITNALDIAGVVNVYSLEQHGDSPVLVFADDGSISLDRMIAAGPTPLLTFLQIAVGLADALGQIHQRNIIHKDLKPAKIVHHPTTQQVKITDFSLASRLSQEHQTISNPAMLEGTLAHMSPEQTGRMNREIDYRTDFYSLGVTLYELLTGQLPFQAADPMDLVHAHLAKLPVAPVELNAAIPPALSAIIMKLLAKTAEERYQSAYGLKADLQECLAQWQAHHSIQVFMLGQWDRSDRFQIAQKLYGRERELEILLAAFERISAPGPEAGAPTHAPLNGTNDGAELMLVSGYSGSGKSALVHEIHKPIAQQKGYFVSGKFDQFQRNIPYRALIQAFQELVRQILTESEECIGLWQARLIRALGGAGQVIIEVIPEVELIIGAQPVVPVLPPAEAQNRFNLLFERYIQVFTQEHPLVIFLDDLQWADSATLRLLMTLMTNASIKHLLIIGAYRDNEVTATHPLMLTLAEIDRVKANVSHIILEALDLDCLNQLIADTLKCSSAVSLPLAELVLQKTGGNPFFVRQFLMSLHQENLLAFNASSGRWDFDLKRIEHTGMTDNVVTLMADKIQKLTDPTQRVLKLAACIGNRFDLGTLAIVNEKSLTQTADDLWQAIEERLILPINNAYEFVWVSDEEASHKIGYRFLHDRVQQAAHALIPAHQRKANHLRVGQLLLEKSSEAEQDEKIFDIVNQLNLGQELLVGQSERNKTARLNLAAGKKAKASAAYKPALSYFQVGRGLLHESSWASDYDLLFALTIEAAECAFLVGQFAEAERDFDLLLEKAKTRLDQAQVYDLQVHHYETLTRYAEAIRAGHAALALFGVTFPQLAEEQKAALADELATIDTLIGEGRPLGPIESLLDLPIQSDPEGQIVMKLLSNLHTSCYLLGDKTLTLLNSARMVRLSLMHGHTPESAHGYVLHAMHIGPIGGDYKAAYEFGLLAMRLNQRLPNPGLRAKILMNFSWAISIWRKPFVDSFVHSQEAFRLGNENGFFSDAGFAIWDDCYHTLLAGHNLDAVQQACGLAVDYLKGKMDGFIDAPQTIRQWARALQGLTEQPTSLSDAHYHETVYQQTHKGHSLFEMFYFIAKLALHYTFDEYSAACKVARQAERVIRDYTGTIWDALRVYYHALSLAALYSSFAPGLQTETWQTLEMLRAKMKIWADNSPENFLNHFLLITAEMARIDGRPAEAMTAYEEAIQAARVHGLVHDEALANELYARFWLERQNEKVARLYLLEAVSGYERWGAQAKVKDLAKQHPRLLMQTPGTPAAHIQSHDAKLHTATTATPSTALDLAAAMKAAQAISREIALATLLENLLRIVIATAGAQKGFLLLEKENQWRIEAAGSVERNEITVLQAVPAESSQELSTAIVNYVRRTGENLVIADAGQDRRWTNDPYIARAKPKSILCALILSHGEPAGILYLENNLVTHAFTPDRIEMIQLLSAQAAISLENARLYEEMKLEVAERRRAEASLRQGEQQLRQLNEQLEDYSRNLEQKVIGRTHEIEQRRRVAESLRDMLTILNSNRSLVEILEHIVAEASRLLGSATSVIYRLEDAENGVFGVQSVHGSLVDPLTHNDFPSELAKTILQGQFVAVADVANAFPVSLVQAPQERGTLCGLFQHCRALLAMPLVIAGEVYGCLLLCYTQPRNFSAEEIDLTVAFSYQAVLAIENARLRQRVEQAAVAEERGRLARELHDSVTQSLYSLTLLAEGWQRLARAGRLTGVEEPLAELGRIAQQALREMRLLVHELRPPALEKEGLVGALHQRLAAVEQRSAVEARLLSDGIIELPFFVEEGLYRIAQEALNNAVKHAVATSVTVRLRSDDESVALEVADNGCGFDPSEMSDRGGVGLLSMRERAEKLGAGLTIDSAPGKGTTICVKIVRSRWEGK